MATDNNDAITFIVPGHRQTSRGGGASSAGPSPWPGRVKDSVNLSAARAGAAVERVIAVPGEDIVVLHIAGGPPLLLHPHTARDLLRGQGTQARSATAADNNADVPVPTQLRWRGLEQAAPTRSRGFLGDVLLSTFEVITGLAKDPAANFVASKVVQKVDGQVEAGVYALQRQALAALKGSGLKLAQVPAPADPARQPLLVLIHGTFVDTFSTFGKLWALHPQRVAQLFDHYGGRVYALDHPTVGASPLANALTLVQALPAGARLHLVTHSRGGLVAEALARVCAQPTIAAADLDFFAGEAYAAQRSELQQLALAVRAKGISVDRVVRVACPARGTLLASKRLDAYLSVLRWTIQLAGVPVVPALVDFLAEVARRRADPTELPGLAAMIPDAPLLNWLNGAQNPLPGDLRVVAGDLQGDSVSSWLKTLLADAYYWTDNDIVVQTRSMYGGAPRQGGASFLLDQGGKVTHFSYFANERTVQAVVDGLVNPLPLGFRTIGPLSWAGQDSAGLRAARRAPEGGPPPADKPAVFVLPGILGSNLQADGHRIWLSLRLIGGLDKLRYAAGGSDGVLPDGPIGLVYDDLLDHLARSHDVIPFAYDWRRPIEEEARRLADAVEAALDARSTSGQPVRLLAHSMGGLVARTLQLERPATWQRLMQHPGARLLMLGTPNGGSWAPMQVLSGDDTFGNALAAFGSPLRDRQARQLMAEMPGFIQLQAGLLDPVLALDRAETWARIADDDLRRVQQNNWWHHTAGEAPDAAYEWGLPPQAVLDQARTLRLRLDAQHLQVLPAFADKVLLVTGHAKFTPDGFQVGDEGFVYLDAADAGDGRVPLGSALLSGVATWTLDCEHGSLPSARAAFDAFVELLVDGSTALLPRLAAASRRGSATAPAVMPLRVPSRPSRARPSALPAQSESSVFSTARSLLPETGGTPGGAALRISVLNGNISFVAQPLLVGHTRSLVLTGTEAVLNRLVGGAMKASLDAGLYPDAPGSHQIFINTRFDAENPWRAPLPASVVVVGLGAESQLSEQQLSRSVRQAVIALAQRAAETPGGAPPQITLASTLMGSGGVGMNASNSARAIALGVRDANHALQGRGLPLVGELVLVELYLERASDAWQGLQVLGIAAPGRYEIVPTIHSGVGPLRRQVDSGYRGTDYDFITATSPRDDIISFALDTKRARTEVRAQSTQGKLLRDLVARASTASNQDPRLGRTLFQLLVPTEVEPFLAGTSRVLLELDEHTAPIPWELLDTRAEDRSGGDDRPWAIRTQLLRKLRQEHYRQQVQDATADDAVLVIGEPEVDPQAYGPLPGARAEAQAVVAALQGPGGMGAQRVTALVDGDDAASVINALFERRYRIVHVAAHGEPVTRDAAGKLLSKGGVVLSNGSFLGSDEINSMRTVPELVFVNCCHLAGRDSRRTLLHDSQFNRAEFAWALADSLIAIGVRCVIAAGWAVDDRPAEVFATTFYRELLDRKPFITAVAAAREAAWNEDRSSNTWAAYQAYGDPNWTYRRGQGDAATVALPPGEEFGGISSPLGLALALEELATKLRWMRADTAEQLAKVRHLEARFGELWGSMGAVAEAFGLAYAEAGARVAAIGWYERAVNCNDASASMKAQEQLLNLQARQAWAELDAQADASASAHADTLASSRKQIQRTLRGLEALANSHPTTERLSLLGSAWKRLALLECRAGNRAAESAALGRAADAYRRATADAPRDEVFYPMLNAMAIDLRRDVQPGAGGLPWQQDSIDRVRASLSLKLQRNPDFWGFVSQVELALYEALNDKRLAEQQPSLTAAYADLHMRVAAPAMWASVADQAQLVLAPWAGNGATGRAAAALITQLNGYAFRPASAPVLVAAPAERRTRAPALREPVRQRAAAAQPAAQAAGVAAMGADGAADIAADIADQADAVVWYAAADRALADTLAAVLRQRGLKVWQRRPALRRADRLAELSAALRGARLAVVVVGKRQLAAQGDQLEEWTLLQDAAWRTANPLRLATLAAGRVRVPDFLQDVPRFSAAALAAKPQTADTLAALAVRAQAGP